MGERPRTLRTRIPPQAEVSSAARYRSGDQDGVLPDDTSCGSTPPCAGRKTEVVCMTKNVLRAEEIRSALSIRDLTEAQAGPHAMQLLLRDVVERLRRDWRCAVLVRRESPIVSVEENYDRLHYPPEGAARDARYTRYLNDAGILRTQTSPMIPDLLGLLAEGRTMKDVLLVCPGLVYRRDLIHPLHAGEPHQVDLWRIRRGAALTDHYLREMARLVVSAALPGYEWRAIQAEYPYTTGGLQIDVKSGDRWVEIGEAGWGCPRCWGGTAWVLATGRAPPWG